ncbi:MAG: translocation/assembly module TamB domain-containing protein, partial [Candidatus Poribacteria bacterium]
AVTGDINIDSIEGSIALKDEMLTVNTTSLKAYDNELTFYGAIPLSEFQNPSQLSKPMQIFIKGEDIDLAPLALLSPIVEDISGKAHLDMALLSKPYPSPHSAVNPFGFGVNPYLTGNLAVTDGRIKLANLKPPIESLKLDLVAQQPDKRGSEIRLNELSFQIGEGRYKIAAAIKMDGLIPRQYDGTLDIDKFQLELIDSLLPERVREPETAISSGTSDSATEPPSGSERALSASKRLSGYLSVNAETKVNLSDLFNISPTLKPERRFWQLLGAAMGSKVTLPEIRIQIAGYPIYNPQPVTIFLDEGSLSLPGCKLDYQSASAANPIFLRAYGRWNSDNQLAFEFRGFADTQMIAEATQLSALLTELTASNNLQQPISGLIEYRVSVRGNASNPQIKVSWPVANIGLLGADVELLGSEISFENGVFNIKEINLVTERTNIENIANINGILVKGWVPFNLSFMPYLLSPSEDELDLTVSASVAKLDSLPLLAMQDAMIDGNGEINIKVSGTIQAPQFSGDITLKNVIYQYENVNVTDTDVELKLNNDSITIEKAQGDFNEGSYNCSGEVGLSEYKLTDLNISGNWRDVEWEQEGLVSLTCEGSVQLLGKFDKPRLEGNVTVKNGSFEQSWQSIVRSILRRQPEGRNEVILDYPLVRDLGLDLNVQIPQEPEHFWLDTIGTKIQPQVNGRVVGPINPISRLVFVGQVNILEGEFSYFNRKFLIKTGTIENSSSYLLDPNYKIDAEIATPIVGAKIPGAQEPKDVKITLNLTGTLQSPQPPVLEAEVIKPDPGEQYDFDQLQILELLTFGNIVRQEGAAVSFASETATDFIMRQAEMFVGAQIADTFNLREFQFDLGNQKGSLPQFLITKDISSQWAVTYMSTNSLSAKPYFLSIEYRINDNISIAGSRNEYSKYGVDLKYGIEW